MDGACKIQFCRRQQRPRADPGRRPDRSRQRGAAARGQDARHLRPCQRSAGLPSPARISHCKTQARCRHRLRCGRYPDRLRLAAGARPRQRYATGPRRHRCHRAGFLPGRAEPADHPARPRGDADGRAGDLTRRPQAPRRHAEIHLHHPDCAEPDRHHHARGAPRRAAEARRTIWRAGIRGRLLRRPDLGRPAPAGAIRHEQDPWRHPHRLIFKIDRAGATGRLHRSTLGDAVADAGAEDRRRLRRARADGARGILCAAFHLACAEADARPARQARHVDGGAQ